MYVSLRLSTRSYIVCLCVRPSVKCKSACMRICAADCTSTSMLLYRFVRFLFFRPSVRSSVRPPVLSSVRQFECKFLSLMHVCMSKIFLISNSKFLTCNCDIYSRVCIRAYECVRRCVHAYEQSVCPCIHPADFFFCL